MSAIIIEGIAPWDGRYEFDWRFTNLELHRIKQISGIRAGELADAVAASDAAVIVAISAVVLDRHDKRADVDELWAGEGGSLRLEVGGDARPPDEPTDDEPSGSTSSSGAASDSTGG